MPKRDAPGVARMRALAADLPNTLRRGFEAGRELALRNGEVPPTVYAVGMGGSGIAADLARGILEAESGWTLTVVRGPELPRSVDARSRVVFVSYSGETSETIRAYRAAGRAGADRTVVTSGGVLAERAEEDGVPILRVPPGLPPRAAVGHLFGGVLGLLDAAFPESNDARVARVADRVREAIGDHARPGGPAAVLAERIGGRLPFVYAESGFVSLARRWKTQFEENAKRLAAFDEAPELFHNAVAAWDAVPRADAERRAAILLEWRESDPAIGRGIRYLEHLLRSRSVVVLRVLLEAEDRLEATVAGISLGDFASLFLAERHHVDPYPVDAIARMKTVTAVAAAGAAGRRPRRAARRRSGRAAPGRAR